MATDATGTPTSPDLIPTYNTSVDAPSGLGFNAAMAALQVALGSRVTKPSGITTGEAAVWDGAAWQRSSTTKIGPTSLTGLSLLDNTYSISAANTDFAFTSSAPEALAGVTTTGTAGTLRSLGAGAFDGQIVRIRHLGAAGTKFSVLNATAGGSGKQFSLFTAAKVMMQGDVLTVQYQGSIFSGAGGWYEVRFDEILNAGQWAGTTSQANGTWTDWTATGAEGLTDTNGNLSMAGGIVTVTKAGVYAVSAWLQIATPGTATSVAITASGTQYSNTTLYGTFGTVSTHLTQFMGPGTPIRGQSWTNGGAQTITNRLCVRYLGAV